MPHAATYLLEERCRRLQLFDASHLYYALTLTATAEGKLGWSAHSHFVGMSSERFGWEMREASQVDPRLMTELWEELGQHWIVVEDEFGLYVWLRRGGNALVALACAQSWLTTIVEPHECAPDGPIGFVRTATVRRGGKTRRGSRIVRLAVLERDEHTCQLCGATAKNATLTRHHLVPRSVGGLSRLDDFVTVCWDCHSDLHAHPERVFGLALELRGAEKLEDTYVADVKAYRQLVARLRLPTRNLSRRLNVGEPEPSQSPHQ